MPTIQYTAQLDFTDNGTFETGWRIKQGDFGDCEIVFRVVNNGVNMYDALVTPEIVFRRADGASVISNMTPNDGTYKYTFVGNELAVPGLTLVDVKYTDSEGRISTASCRFTVVEDTFGYDPTGAHTYDNPVSELVETATVAAETAIDSSFKAEGFAVGEQGGVPVGSDSPYYHNNAKYYGTKNAEDIEYYENHGFLSKNIIGKLYNLSGNTSTGEFAYSASFVGTDFIEVDPTKTYRTSLDGVAYAFRWFFYQSDYTYISSSFAMVPEFPANTKYVRMHTGDLSGNLNSKVQLEEGSTVSAYTPYAPSNITLDAKKADITSIGTDESGRTTASQAYAIGEHFYKDGKFCTAKTAIASGATFTLNTNYEEGDISTSLKSAEDTLNNDVLKCIQFGGNANKKFTFSINNARFFVKLYGASGETVAYRAMFRIYLNYTLYNVWKETNSGNLSDFSIAIVNNQLVITVPAYTEWQIEFKPNSGISLVSQSTS